jgi:UDP-N-acetyl-D-galactosamine dehydrogenase
VAPYYPTYKAQILGCHSEVILAGRRINDSMGKFVTEQTVKRMIQVGSSIKGARVNVLGITFKEDVPDLRNSKVWDLIMELRAYGVEVFVHDPVADAGEAMQEYGVELVAWDALPQADAVVLAVAHRELLAQSAQRVAATLKAGGCLVDVKGRAAAENLRDAGIHVWRL